MTESAESIAGDDGTGRTPIPTTCIDRPPYSHRPDEQPTERERREIDDARAVNDATEQLKVIGELPPDKVALIRKRVREMATADQISDDARYQRLCDDCLAGRWPEGMSDCDIDRMSRVFDIILEVVDEVRATLRRLN